MTTPQLMSQQELLDLHTKASEHLKTKLSAIHPRVLGNVNIFEIYKGISQAPVAKIPADLPLGFVFDRYDDLRRANFTMRKDQKDPDLNRLIWYYQIDTNRCAYAGYDQIRYNLILLVIIFCSPDDKYKDRKAGVFGGEFLLAWQEALVKSDNVFSSQEEFLALWMRSPLDFIRFGSQQRQKLANALRALTFKPLPTHINIDHVIEGKTTREEFDQHGAALVLHWCMQQMQEARIADIKAKSEQASKPGLLGDALANTSLNNETLIADLAQVN